MIRPRTSSGRCERALARWPGRRKVSRWISRQCHPRIEGGSSFLASSFELPKPGPSRRARPRQSDFRRAGQIAATSAHRHRSERKYYKEGRVGRETCSVWKAYSGWEYVDEGRLCGQVVIGEKEIRWLAKSGQRIQLSGRLLRAALRAGKPTQNPITQFKLSLGSGRVHFSKTLKTMSGL
jgi:hypothetical protein